MIPAVRYGTLFAAGFMLLACGSGVDTLPPSANAQRHLLYQDEILKEPSLVGYWRLNETGGTTAKNLLSTSSIGDGGYSGTSGGYELGKAGPFSDSLNPDLGVAFVQGKQSKMRAAGFDFADGNLTLEIWVNAPDCNGTAPYLAARNAGNAIVELSCASSNLRFAAQSSFGGDTKVISTSDSVTTDQRWHHLVATKAGNALKLYVDGMPLAQDTGDFNISGNFNLDLGIFVGNDNGANFAAGLFSEAAVYDAALDGPTVLRHFQLASGSVTQ